MLKSWTKRTYILLPSGRRYWRVYSRSHKGSLVIECDRNGDWMVTYDPIDILAEVFYPPFGLGDSLKEAMKEFRVDIKSERKRYE